MKLPIYTGKVPYLTTAQMVEVDRLMIEDFKIELIQMMESAGRNLDYQDIPPYLKMAYDAFGAGRMMWGSDYPRVIMREGYRNSLEFTKEQMPFCSNEELEWVFGKTALSLWKFAQA